MTTEAKVKRVYPEAYSWFNGLWWNIHEKWDKSSPILGSGTLEEDAWKEAEQYCNKIHIES